MAKRVGKSVQMALEECEMATLESAVLHACNAVDGTANMVYTGTKIGNRRRCM